jgi:hypothetical protein
MGDEKKLSELEYFQALLGDDLGSKAVKLRKVSLWTGLIFVAFAAIIFLFVLPSTLGPVLPPTSLLNAWPFYFQYYWQLGNAELGTQVWWVMFLGVCFLATLTAVILIWLISVLVGNKRAQIGFKAVPIFNPPVFGMVISLFPVLSLLLSDLWKPLILGGYKVFFGPGVLFLGFWCLGFVLAIFLVWHICIFLCLLAVRILDSGIPFQK